MDGDNLHTFIFKHQPVMFRFYLSGILCQGGVYRQTHNRGCAEGSVQHFAGPPQMQVKIRRMGYEATLRSPHTPVNDSRRGRPKVVNHKRNVTKKSEASIGLRSRKTIDRAISYPDPYPAPESFPYSCLQWK